MDSTTYWEQRHNTIYSTVGHWQGGVDVIIAGYSLMTQLMPHCTFMQVHILNATGKLVDKAIADWLEVNFMGVSYPDSRIWCNQVSAYAADTKATVVAAASAAILAADSRAYGGGQTTRASMIFLQQAFAKFNKGYSFHDIVSSAKQVKGKPIIVGFARPIDRDDERLTPYKSRQKALGIPEGKFVRFAQQLSRFLDEHYHLSMNSGGYSAAFLLDQGFTPDEAYKIKAFAVISGAIGCYRDVEKLPPNSFLPQKCCDIDYIGRPIRKLR